MNNKLPYKGMADQVASRGRYGDTTLMHVNPIEVQGLASLTPLTINPDTGYPEAFLPLLAPFLGTALGTAIGGAAGATGLGLTAAGAAGSGLATGLATGSVEEGLMAGLTGFGLGSALQGAGSALNPGDAVIPTPELAPSAVGQTVPASGLNLPPLTPTTPVGGIFGQSINPITEVASGGSTAKDILGSSEGLKAFGTEALKMKNLVPIASGLGGISVTEDIKRSNANIQGMKDRKEREGKEAIANYVENRPGMTQAPFSSQYTPGMQPQGMPQSGTSMKNPYANRYASGGRVRRFKGAGDIGLPTTYVDENGVTQTIDYSQIPNLPNSTPEPTPVQSAPEASPVMPDISKFSMGYDPSAIDMATGLRKTPEQLQGMVRGRGLTPVPYDYMAGFMPEYQYVSNIQPTSTSLGSTGTGTGQQVTLGGSGPMGIPNVTVGGTNVYKGSYDPDLFAGGTPYNEYLLGNTEKGMPSYLSSYMQNTPYYQYQDQQLNNIYGGGGYGTPGFMGAGNQQPQPQPQPQPIDETPTTDYESKILTLNERIDALMKQIEEGSNSSTPRYSLDETGQPLTGEADYQTTYELDLGDGRTQQTLTDSNPESPTYGQVTYSTTGGASGGDGTFNPENFTTIDNFGSTYTQSPDFFGRELGNRDRGQIDLGQTVNVGFDDSGNLIRRYFDYDGNEVGTKTGDGDNAIFTKSFASGGQIKNSINTLEQYAQPLPMGNISLGNMYAEGGTIDYETGGMIQDDKVDALMQNPVIQEKMSEGDRGLLQQASFVLLGRIDDDGSIISEFVDKFGSDALDMLKGELLPNMQQQGMIEGEGGGMDDKVDGVIGDQERVAVSPGEYIVPADVVGNLGDGNSEQGARIMDDFLARVRTEKNGKEEQPNPINLDNVMPS